MCVSTIYGRHDGENFNLTMSKEQRSATVNGTNDDDDDGLIKVQAKLEVGGKY